MVNSETKASRSYAQPSLSAAAINFTDFLTAVLTLYYSHALHPNLYGSNATGNVINSATGTQFPGSQQYPVARDRQDIVLQGDLITKF